MDVAVVGGGISGLAAAYRLTRAGASVIEIKGSHAVYVSQPRAVAGLIEKAAKGSLIVSK